MTVMRSDDLALPWRTASSWQEAVRTLDRLVEGHGASLNAARDEAHLIHARLERLFPDLDALCRVTCTRCAAPCCLHAAVYADFRDLLFWTLAGVSSPPGQLRRHSKESCRFSSPRGCTLARMQRPWICTWYLCADQWAVLRRWDPHERQRFEGLLEEVRTGRKEMEEAFLRAVA